MAKNTLPIAKERREMLANSSAQLGQAGRALWEAGRWGEAMECLRSAEDAEGLAQAERDSFEAGDYFFWKQALAGLGKEITSSALEQLIANAASAGKENFAAAAQAQLDTPED